MIKASQMIIQEVGLRRQLSGQNVYMWACVIPALRKGKQTKSRVCWPTILVQLISSRTMR